MVARAIGLLIRVYQHSLSPLLTCFGCGCRYYPSCSRYAIICLRNYGIITALRMSVGRVLRCHPFAAGGVDLPNSSRTATNSPDRGQSA